MDQIAYLALGATAGALIGCVGIGGVILVPALVYLAGHPFAVAIAAVMCAFIASGLVGVYKYAKAGSIRWKATAWTWIGAKAAHVLPAEAPRNLVAAVLVVVGATMLVRLAAG